MNFETFVLSVRLFGSFFIVLCTIAVFVVLYCFASCDVKLKYFSGFTAAILIGAFSPQMAELSSNISSSYVKNTFKNWNSQISCLTFIVRAAANN